VFLFARKESVSGDAAANLARLVEVEVCTAVPDLDDVEVIVDALLGTGLARPVVDGLYRDVIQAVNRSEAEVYSVDIPSGLDADMSEILGDAIEADITVTFTGLKPCLVFPPSHLKAGHIVVSDIGNPPELVNAPDHRLNFITSDDFPNAIHRRKESTHKGDYGKILVIGGSRGKSGAAAMAGQASLRAGAGLVTVATAGSVLPIIAASMLELMTEALPETDSGTIANDSIANLIESKTVLAIGPGIGTHKDTQAFVRSVVRDASIPIVLDADGLNAYAGRTEELRGNESRPIVITPHPGEMSRLIGRDSAFVNANRIAVSRELAVAHNLYVVLKGFRTVIAAPDGTVYINGTGNPGMATGGMGDILTGMIAGILGQNSLGTLIERLCFAVHLHGLAGDVAAEEVGEEPLVATDLLRYIGAAWKRIRDDFDLGS
jgi:NAD(P)H-hydrate epimerase